MAGVSTPTISRFENGEKDVQLSSVMSILTVLGMVDQRQLIFPDPEEWYDKHRMSVFFNGKDGDTVVQCIISREALEDHFGDDKEAPLKIFKANGERIEHEARRKYLGNQLEADGSILIRTGDL